MVLSLRFKRAPIWSKFAVADVSDFEKASSLRSLPRLPLPH